MKFLQSHDGPVKHSRNFEQNRDDTTDQQQNFPEELSTDELFEFIEQLKNQKIFLEEKFISERKFNEELLQDRLKEEQKTQDKLQEIKDYVRKQNAKIEEILGNSQNFVEEKNYYRNKSQQTERKLTEVNSKQFFTLS